MRRFFGYLCLLGGVVLAPLVASAAGLSPAQEQRLQSIMRQSERFEQSGEPVRAYLTLREAQRLEQLWTNNLVGDEAISSQQMNLLVTRLLRRDDATVMRILHSKQVALGDKLSLLHVLEQDILLNYPGTHSEGLLSNYEESAP